MAGKHVRVSAEKKSHATKRSFSSSDAKNISQQCQKIQEALNEIAKSDAIYRESIQQETNRYVATQVLKLMEKIPVEEVNRDKHGIRVKALRDSGYVTYADILTSSIYQLAAIRGISEDGARIIKRIVSEAADKASTTTKLRLSADNRTEDMTRLITAVSQYQQAKPLAEESNRLSQQYSNTIQNALEDIKVSTGTFRWLFASRQTKQNAIESYKLLEETLHGEYGQTAERLQSGSVAIEALAEDDAWDSFKKHPISYANTLEEIVPGLLGNGDTVYGLPENLAKEVQEECFFPDGLLCDLRRYQEWGVKYILHQKKALLGDEMGLGKTIQAIATMVSLRNTGATHFIVICPASVIVNWCREIQKFSKLRVIAVHGLSRESALKDWQRTGGVAVTTYETTAYFKFPDNFTYSLLVVDEAHYIKNPSTNRSKNTKAIAEHAERLLFMTGTALENKVDEMINLIKLLQPSIAMQISGMKELSSAPQFKETVAPVYYRRRREDVLTELPELSEIKEWCQLSDSEERRYEETVFRKNYNAIRRVSWNVPDLKDSGKAKRLLEIIEEAKSEGRKVLVFSFYLDTIRKIAGMLGSQCTEPINGSITPTRRQEIIDDFDKAPAGQVLVAQIVAGGTGLNIQSASVVIICEPQLKPSIENQAISRAYRMGQARNVLVYRLLAENTIDEKITDILARKQEVFNAFANESAAAENVEVDEKSLGNNRSGGNRPYQPKTKWYGNVDGNRRSDRCGQQSLPRKQSRLGTCV